MLLLTGPNSSELMVSDDYRDAVPAEATVFLCAVGVILVLLLLAFIYMNKRLCMHELDGSCCEDLLRQQKQHPSRSSIESREDDDDSCSDGDDELVRRLRAAPASTKPRYSSPRLAHRPGRGAFTTSHSFDSECLESAAKHEVDSKRPRSLLSTGISYERPSLYRQFSLQPIVAQNSGLSTSGTTGRRDAPHVPRRLNGDLTPIERGKLSGTISTSCSSSSSSTTSAEDDSLCSLRHRDVRRYRTLCSGRPRTVHATTDADPGLFEETPETEDRLFDVADLTSGGSGALSRCGALEVACAYDFHTRKLSVQLLQARDVPTRDRGGASNCQVRLVLLPGKKQRLRSRMQSGENPHFNEAFVFNRIDAGDVPSMGVRLRLYGCERLRRERLIGENVLPFSSANVEQQTPQWVTLLPRALISITSDGSVGEVSSLCRSESTSSTQSIHRGGVPELLVGLQYSAITGRLAVEVIKGSHFRTANSSRAPDTYVRLNLLSGNRHEIGRGKTSVRRGQPNPLFKETFMFQVPLFQLADVTLMVSVYYKRNMKKRDLLGWFSLGWSSSDDEGRSHWLDARDASSIQICRWHMLCEQ